METTIIGLIDNTLYLHPFYGGDHIHQATVSDTVKSDLIERHVRVFTSYEEIEEHVYGSYRPKCKTQTQKLISHGRI